MCKVEKVSIHMEEDEWTTFNDSYTFSLDNGCNCPFFAQFVAPCVHAFMVMGESAIKLLYPAWRVSNIPRHPACTQLCRL